MELDAGSMRETERARLRALVQADMDTAAALHAEDYQLITPRGYAMSKQDYLGRIASGRLRYRVFEPVSDIAVRGSGEVALVRYQARISVTEDDDENGDAGTAGSTGNDAIICWHTDCYERRDARWQAVWSQATAIMPELSRLTDRPDESFTDEMDAGDFVVRTEPRLEPVTPVTPAFLRS